MPLVLDQVVAEALMSLPWGGPDTLRVDMRLSPDALVQLLSERPDLIELEMVRGTPVAFLEDPPPPTWDCSIRCVLALSRRWREVRVSIEALLHT